MNVPADRVREQIVSIFTAWGMDAALVRTAAVMGMELAVKKAEKMHVGVVPTRAKVPVLGTNPIAFAAPAKRNAPFLLDMATSAAANNKIKVYGLNGKRIPKGWVFDDAGAPVTDPDLALKILYETKKGGLTPLGGTPEMSSHKGYGLALMVHILGGAFEDDLDAVIDVLHGTPPLDPAQPVLVPGDPEAASRQRRLKEGIPIPDSLLAKLRQVCENSKVPCIL